MDSFSLYLLTRVCGYKHSILLFAEAISNIREKVVLSNHLVLLTFRFVDSLAAVHGLPTAFSGSFPTGYLSHKRSDGVTVGRL